MSLTYGQCDINSNLIYNSNIQQLVITDSKEDDTLKRDNIDRQRKFNNDMKLLLAEINFINKYVENDDEILIVYIGCSPGLHLVKLLKMFPFIKFHLYDPEDPHSELLEYIKNNSDKITFYKELFTIETCNRYKKSSIYLMTDFRDIKYNVDPYFGLDFEAKNKWQMEKEKSYVDDMEFQKQICILLEPKVSFLRFRPPHFYSNQRLDNISFEYFHGVIWLMIFNELKSTESRIVVTDYTTTDFKWNYQLYQYRLNYFNFKLRESMLLNPFTNDKSPLQNQLGNKFETVLMIKIIIDYFNVIGYPSPRQIEILDFYSNFLVAETCSDVVVEEICEDNNIPEQEIFVQE